MREPLDPGPPFDAREILSRATESDWRHVFAETDLLAREGRWADLGALREAAGERSEPAGVLWTPAPLAPQGMGPAPVGAAVHTNWSVARKHDVDSPA